MKKALRIIVPLILVLVVLGSIFWYLFVYDSAFTRDVLLHRARYYEKQGNNAAAARIYNMAYLQADEKQDVAIELADHFISIGNFTQAERTLSDAIAHTPTVELYTKLSMTYVEQDKLLDAAALLNNITDPVIKQELDDMRPAAPVPTQAPGFYNQYITLDFEPAEGRLFVTTDGQYPSIQGQPFSEPLTLPGGESKIYAVTIGDSGLVSPLATFGYTVVGVIEEVSFRDPAVEQAVRTLLHAGKEQVLFTDDLWQIESFTIPDGAESYDDLGLLLGLKELVIDGMPAEDLSFLPSLDKLTSLKILNTAVSAEAMDTIGRLPALEALTIKNSGVSGIAPLREMTSLISLDLSDNAIRDLDAISQMTNLQTLYLQHNAVTSLDALQSLQQLKTLNVSYNAITSAEALSKCPHLEWLNLSYNKLNNLDMLHNMSSLKVLHAAFNALQSAAPVTSCVNLVELDLSHNQIGDLTGFEALVSLQKFNMSFNHIGALPSWPVDCALAHLDASYNYLDSVAPLERLHNLTKVNVDYNAGITTLDPLADCHKLVQVDAYGTQVTEALALTYHEIIVNFDPTTAFIGG